MILNKHQNITNIFKLPAATVRLTYDGQSTLIDVGPFTQWYVNKFVKEPSAPIFKKLGILKVKDLYKLATLKFVHESVNKQNPAQFHSYYCYPAHTYNTDAMRDYKLDPPVIRTSTYGLKSLKYSGCILWNNLSVTERNIMSKKAFLRVVKDNMANAYEGFL